MRQPRSPRTIDARAGVRVLGVGVALLATAVVFDAEPLYVPAIALAGLALLAAVWAALVAAGAGVERQVEARRVVESEPLRARVSVRGGPIGLTGASLVDPLLAEPRPLSGLARRQRLRIDARFDRRGRRELPPPVLVCGDPLGLVTIRRRAADPSTSVLVLPRVDPVLAARGGGGDGTGSGLHRAARGGAEVELDGLRPWRPGAPASRIHWPALARGAGLVERRMLPEADGRPLVVLDPRHPRDDAALDAAVRATASLAVALARRGGCALLLPGDRRPVALDGDLRGWPALHVRLALLEAGAAPAFAAVRAARGPLVLVLAHAPAAAPRALLAAPAARRTLVVPGAVDGRAAAFRVGGCTGYDVPRGAAQERAA